jgi:hypothetical protein
MDILSQVAKGMQVILTKTADILGREIGFIKRQRKLSGSNFVQALVFGWLSEPDSTLEELCQSLATLGTGMSAPGLSKRFTQKASEFLRKVLESAVEVVIASNPVAIPILERFNGVSIQDSSIITLPDELAETWVGCGGSSPENTSSSLKFQLRLNLNTGKLLGPYLQSGRDNDRNSQLSKIPLSKGGLRIADLGYFTLGDFNQMNTDGTYWLSRIKARCKLHYESKEWDLLKFLGTHCKNEGDELDIQLELGQKERVSCRLMAKRVSDKLSMIRRCKLESEARAKGEKVSENLLRLASWAILGCNVPYELLNMDEAFVLMGTRWQIELLFRLWKSQGKIDEWRTENPWRIMCEVYAKLLAMIIQHWLLLAGCWEYPNRSLSKAVKTIQKHAMALACAFASGYISRLREALEAVQRCLSIGCRINKRKKDPSTYQLLLAIDGGS